MVTNWKVVPHNEVKVTDRYYDEAFKIQVRNMLLLDPDRLLAGFRETAGYIAGMDEAERTAFMKGKARYGGAWEDGMIGGHTLGHYITALAQAVANPALSGEELEKVKERLDYSVVKDSKTGNLIIKVVSLLPKAANLKINLGEVAKEYNNTAELYELSITNNPDRQREWEVNKYQDPIPVTNSELTMKVSQYSVSVLRIKKSSSKH